MNSIRRWSLYYAVVFVAITVVTTYYMHVIEPARYQADSYGLMTSAMVGIIYLLPFYLLTVSGLQAPERAIRRAIGTGWLVWAAITVVCVGLIATGFPDAKLLIYLSDVLIGFFLIWYFRFSAFYAILPIVLPGIALLYFLIYGQVRDKERAFA